MPTRHACCLGSVLLCLVTGCGLADYEKRMDQQRARLRVFDEENKFLGDMLEPPPQAADLFLRLPRGISRTIADQNGEYFSNGLTIYRYPGAEGNNVFLAISQIGARAPNGPKHKDLTPGEFRSEFRLAVAKILKKSFGPPGKMERVQIQPPPYAKDKGPDLDFDSFVLEEEATVPNATSVSIFFYQTGPRLLALAFQVPEAEKNEMATQKGLNLCLRSLDLGESGLRKRNAFAGSKRLD